jgi:chemotaxis protein CheD
MTTALEAISSAREGVRRTHVVQGQFYVSSDPNEVLTTILGSCVAACIRDPVARIGGINHFLLPGEAGEDGLRYGVNAMELLVNELLKGGAKRNRLEAKVFGGAQVVKGLSDIGAKNVEFANRYFRDEGIMVTAGSTGGFQARRIEFWPATGRSRQLFMNKIDPVVLERPVIPAPAPRDEGALELF